MPATTAGQCIRPAKSLARSRLVLAGVFMILTGCLKTSSETPTVTPSIKAPATAKLESKPVVADTTRSATNDRVELEMVDLPGYERAVAAHLGRVVLVDFWATWCAPCRKQFPHTIQLQRRLQNRGLTVLTVSIDQLRAGETLDQLKSRVLKFLVDQQATFPNLLAPVTDLAPGDPGAADLIAARFDLDGGAIPHFKLYDRRGNLYRKFVVNLETGESFDPLTIDAAVEQLLATEP